MARELARRAAALAVALALVLTFAPTVLAVTYWYAGCTLPPQNYVCVWRDVNFTGPYGHWFGGDPNYTGQNYPASGTTVNNTVSSVSNRYTANDVTWYNDPNYSGGSLCVTVGFGYSLNWFTQDRFSSHYLELNNGVC